jgi:hypothetical protein
VKLRDHPRMNRKSGFKTWPPLWTTTRRDQYNPTGEIGTLQQILMSELIDDKLFMFIEYQGFRYMGAMAFDDPTFCREIYTLLKSKIGVSIKEIGDIDLSPTL